MADKQFTVDIIFRGVTQDLEKNIKSAETSLGSIDKTLGRVMRTFTAFAALAAARKVMDSFSDSTKLAADFSFQLALVGRASGITGRDLDNLKESIRNIAKETGIAQEELTALAISAGRAGVSSVDAMVDIAKLSAMMSRISDMSAPEATNAILKITKAMGLLPSEGNKVLSVILKMGVATAATEQEITSAMLRMVSSGKTLGLTTPELAAIAAATIEIGVQANRAGTEWNRALFEMVKNVDKASKIMGPNFKQMIEEGPREALIDLMIEIAKIPSTTEKLKVIQDIFGGIGSKGVAPLIDSIKHLTTLITLGNEEWDKGTKVLDDYRKLSGEAKIVSDRLRESFKDLKITLGDQLLPSVIDLDKALIKIIETLNQSLKSGRGGNTLFSFIQNFLKYGPSGLAGFAADLGGMIGKRVVTGKTQEDWIAQGYGDKRTEVKKGLIPETSSIQPEVDTSKIDLLKQQINEFNVVISKAVEESAKLGERAGEIVVSTIQSLSKGFGDAIANMIIYGKNLGDSLKDMFKQVAAQFISQIVAMITQWLIFSAIGSSIMASIAAASVAMAGVITAAWTPAAAMVSLATFGENAMPAMGGIAGTMAFAKSMAALGSTPMRKGGIVPGMGRGDKIPTLLEPGEMVIPRQQVQNYNHAGINVSVNMAGAMVMDNPIAVQRLYRDYLREQIQSDIRMGRDNFYG